MSFDKGLDNGRNAFFERNFVLTNSLGAVTGQREDNIVNQIFQVGSVSSIPSAESRRCNF